MQRCGGEGHLQALQEFLGADYTVEAMILEHVAL